LEKPNVVLLAIPELLSSKKSRRDQDNDHPELTKILPPGIETFT
jgi:hypothetical protein